MLKSKARTKMERAVLEAVYQMASESMSPDEMTKLEASISTLHSTRSLGDFERFPRPE
jgi:hypothetical protein